MEFAVYILYSYSADKFYIGYSGSLIERFRWHNKAKKGFTLRYRPWSMIHVEFYSTKEEALGREKKLKGGQGRKWIKTHFDKTSGFISA